MTVQTAKVGQEHLTTIVTASGQITPKTYSNLLAQGYGQITDILAKEGEQVKRGDILLRIDSIQPAADAQAGAAGISSCRSSAAIRAGLVRLGGIRCEESASQPGEQPH